MNSLHALILAAEGTCPPASEPPILEIGPVGCEATKFAQAVTTAAAFRGLSCEQVQCLVVAGPVGSDALGQVSQALPGLRSIVVLDAASAVRNAMCTATIEWSGVLTDRDCWFVDLIAEEEEVSDRYVALANALMQVRAELRKCVFVDAGALVETVPPYGATNDVAGLLESHGMAFFRQVSHRGERVGSDWLRTFGDVLFRQREYLHALNCYMAAHARRPTGAMAQQITATWHALECPRRALEWLDLAELPEAAKQDIGRQLREQLERQRDDERDTALANAEHLAREYPDLSRALQHTPPAELDVAWLRQVPWVLGSEEPGKLVSRQDYPVLLRVESQRVEAINLPLPPSCMRATIDSVPNVLYSHVAVGSLAALDALLNVLRNPVVPRVPNWKQQIYVAHENLELLARVLQVCDLRSMLVGDRIILEWGPKAEQRLVQRFRQHSELCIPAIRFALAESLEAGLEAAARGRLKAAFTGIARIAESHDERRLRHTLCKLDRGEKLRIWALTSARTTVLQYMVRDLLDAFERLGHECHLLVEKGPGEYVGNLVAASVADVNPDVLLFADHLRAQVPNVLPQTLPSMSVIMDQLPSLCLPQTIANLGPYDLAFPWSHALAGGYLKNGYPHAKCLPLAANYERYAVAANRPVRDAVAFATHVDELVDHERAPGFLALLEQQLRAERELPRGTEWTGLVVDKLVREHGLDYPRELCEELDYQALMLVRVLDRVMTAERLLAANLPVVLFGRGWERYEQFAPYFGGVLTPGDALREMYQSHKVVLHINQNCNLHPRVLETMCAGGFVLARDDGVHDKVGHPDSITNYFDLDRELCLFTDTDDMVDKVQRALTDEDWRQGFIVAGRERVRSEHTYVHRAETMLSELRRRLADGLDVARGGESPHGASELARRKVGGARASGSG